LQESATIRPAIESHAHRLVEESDIVAGAEIEMIEREKVQRDPFHPTNKITIDDDPIRDGGRGRYVYYHCTKPAWDGQCFVPLEVFLGNGNDEGSHHVNYWLPRNSYTPEGSSL